MTSGVNYIAIIYRRKFIIAYNTQKINLKGGIDMKKQKIRIYDENWKLENEFYVEIPTTDKEREIKQREKEIKDFLYSIRFLRFLAYKILSRGDRNAR